MLGIDGFLSRAGSAAAPADPAAGTPVSTAGGVLWDDHRTLRLEWGGAGAAVRWNQARDLFLVFYGDHFGEASLESICRLYREIGVDALKELNGCFSGVLIDRVRRTAVLFNDRYGLGRIYYHEAPEGFHFSSRAKSLWAAMPSLRRIDPRGLAEFYSLGCVLQNRSLFEGISLLPPGAAWTLHRDGRVEKGRYFDPSAWEGQPSLSSADYGDRLREVFSRICPRYLGGGPVGMSLTGGLDSRLILAWSGAAPAALPCYTFSGPYRDCADVRLARRLAKISGQSHATLRIGTDFFADFPGLAAATVDLSDGTMDVSGAVELYVNRLARGIAPVRLTGNYGSEILRSHVAFRPRALDLSLFTPEFGRLVAEASETYRAEAAGHRLSFIAFKQMPWHHYGRRSIEASQLSPRSPFLDNELVAVAYQAPRDDSDSAAPLLRLISEGNRALGGIGTDRALRRRPLPLVSRWAASWQDFTAKAEYASDYGLPRWAGPADRALAWLRWEKLFLGRHKFYHFRVWYRDRLRETVRAGLESESAPFCYRPGAIEKIVLGHLGGRSNRTLELHQLLSVQLMAKNLRGTKWDA